jgi:Tol biopolymer transport system component
MGTLAERVCQFEICNLQFAMINCFFFLLPERPRFPMSRFLCLLLLLLVIVPAPAQDVKLLIAFASFRERRLHPKVYFYEHDGVGSGKIVGSIDAVNQRSDYRPSLSHDGRYCAFASELENQTGRISFWDRKEKKLVVLPKINDSPNAQLSPSLSGDGKLLAFTAWNRPGASTRWNVLLYDTAGKKLLDLPGLNRPGIDTRMSALSGDGRWLACVTATKHAATRTDLLLYDRKESKVVDVAKLNSPYMDVEPSLSHDGRLLAFVSDRPGGKGGRDVYLFDRVDGKYLPLPGLNSAAHEQSPALSPGGRFLAFVSERIKGEGERDVYLYDRKTGKLLSTPGLNSKVEDFDPCVIVLEGKE